MMTIDELQESLIGKSVEEQQKEIKEFIKEAKSVKLVYAGCSQGVDLSTLKTVMENTEREARLSRKLYEKHPMYSVVKQAKKIMKSIKKSDSKKACSAIKLTNASDSMENAVAKRAEEYVKSIVERATRQ